MSNIKSLARKYSMTTWDVDDYFGKGRGFAFSMNGKQVSAIVRDGRWDVAAPDACLYFGDNEKKAAEAVVRYLQG